MKRAVLLCLLVGCSSSSSSGGSGAAALPATSFVFVRGTQIVAFDTGSSSEKVLATLEGASRPEDVALSPDRTKVAFIGVFRPGGETVKGDDKAVWTMGADGSGLQRLTPPVAADAEIQDQAIDRASPEWTRDGSSVVFVLATTGKKGAQTLNESELWQASASGVAKYGDANADCALISSPRFSGDGMTSILKACSKSANGIAIYDALPPGEPSSRIAGTDGSDGPAIVSPDGATLYYRVQVGAHTALVSRPSAGGKAKTLYAPADANVAGYDLSPDGTQIVAGVGGCKIVVLSSLDAATPTVTPVTESAGGSCAPSWH